MLTSHQEVEKSKSRKFSIYSAKSIILTTQQEVEKSKSRKKNYIFSKIDHFDPLKDRKVKKSKKSNIYSVKLIILTPQQKS